MATSILRICSPDAGNDFRSLENHFPQREKAKELLFNHIQSGRNLDKFTSLYFLDNGGADEIQGVSAIRCLNKFCFLCFTTKVVGKAKNYLVLLDFE